MIPRVRTSGFMLGEHLQQSQPFVLDTRFHDIPKTVRSVIRALPSTCVAVSLRVLGGPQMIKVAEREARVRGVRVLWV